MVLDSKAEVKKWARGMLKEEPCKFVTQKGLLLALKHNAPLPVIQFMLKINPNIMNFPKKGPTPLQVAVQCNAALDVIKILLDASPMGECIRNPDFPESPLEFAKRCRSDRPDLIELLSRKTNSQDQDCNKKHKEKVKAVSEFTLFPRFSSGSYGFLLDGLEPWTIVFVGIHNITILIGNMKGNRKALEWIGVSMRDQFWIK